MTYTNPATTQRGRRGIRSGIAGILAAATLMSGVACSAGDSTGPGNRDPVGPYALLQIEQRRIPAEIYRGPYTFPTGYTVDPFTMTITGGELILQNDGSIRVAIDYRVEGEGKVVTGSNVQEGTYEIDGDEILIAAATGGGTVGSYRNGMIMLPLDLVGNGEHWAYTFRRGR